MEADQREIDDRSDVGALLANIQVSLPRLQELLDECSSEWGYEDPIYRYYHHSFKVYGLQETTKKIVATLQELLPSRPLNESFIQIVNIGTGKRFDPAHNRQWGEVTRPILEAFFHSRYFLEMAVRYGQQLEHPPRCLPSGWASLLYLYGLR